ncbi:MAG: hypothetical protein M3N97_14825 [Pseudomonadota bacterium]|nr:hypothetical protein [Pseudomonadota bacterium]
MASRVYTHDDGSEAPFDAAASVKKTRDLEAALMSEKIAVNFDRSRMVGETLSVPPDLVRAKFGDAFKLEDGKVVAFDKNGKKIYSSSRALAKWLISTRRSSTPIRAATASSR